jgi:3-deoxy-7-phosphoheptulonate synthase
MSIIWHKDATEQQKDEMIRMLREEYGLRVQRIRGTTGVETFQIIGEEPEELKSVITGMPGVVDYIRINASFKLGSREFHPEYKANGDTHLVTVGNVIFGGEDAVIIAGPCTVYTLQQTLQAAAIAKSGGAHLLRGGAFKPRTTPHSFTGREEEGLKYLAEAREATGLPIITEVLDPRDVEMVARYADMLQIGTRSAQNQSLYNEVGRSGKPVLVKRGFGNTVEEWLDDADRIAAQGNLNLVLCERGIRTVSNTDRWSGGRFTLDLQGILAAREYSIWPVIADPSHATGKRPWVPLLAEAAMIAGAHGLEIDVMRENEQPRITYTKDGKERRAGYIDFAQGLRPREFNALMDSIHAKGLDKVVQLHLS